MNILHCTQGTCPDTPDATFDRRSDINGLIIHYMTPAYGVQPHADHMIMYTQLGILERENPALLMKQVHRKTHD